MRVGFNPVAQTTVQTGFVEIKSYYLRMYGLAVKTAVGNSIPQPSLSLSYTVQINKELNFCLPRGTIPGLSHHYEEVRWGQREDLGCILPLDASACSTPDSGTRMSVPSHPSPRFPLRLCLCLLLVNRLDTGMKTISLSLQPPMLRPEGTTPASRIEPTSSPPSS